MTLSEDYGCDHRRLDILTYCRKVDMRRKREVCEPCSAASLKYVACSQSPQAVKPREGLRAEERESCIDE